MVLLSATPIKNKADDVVELLNYMKLCYDKTSPLLLKKDYFNYGNYVEDI